LKIKVGEDLPKAVAESLCKVIPDALTGVDEGLSGTLYANPWDTTQREGRFPITGDKAFANIIKFPPGTHHRVLLLRPNENGIQEELLYAFCCLEWKSKR
jgi:Domain of unknown function (DUF5615)